MVFSFVRKSCPKILSKSLALDAVRKVIFGRNLARELLTIKFKSIIIRMVKGYLQPNEHNEGGL